METEHTVEKSPITSALAGLMSPVIGILVGQTILKVLDELPVLIRQEKIIDVQKKLDGIKKRHNKSRFTMIQAKRSCKKYVNEQNKH
jgi:hypothetical protein